jgi:hypothetical protein
MYSLDAVFHGDSIAPKISQIGKVQLELCPSAKERRVLKSVTNKYFSISIKCNAECDGVCWLFLVVHSSEHEVQSSYGRRCCLLACKRAWHKCDKSIQYRIIFHFLPCTTGSGVDGDFFPLFCSVVGSKDGS